MSYQLDHNVMSMLHERTATYAKLNDGSWGVRVTGQTVQVSGQTLVGQTVTVTKRSGETKNEVISRVLYTAKGVSLCGIKPSANGGGRPKLSAYPRTGCSCGSREGYPRDSDCTSCQHDY